MPSAGRSQRKALLQDGQMQGTILRVQVGFPISLGRVCELLGELHVPDNLVAEFGDGPTQVQLQIFRVEHVEELLQLRWRRVVERLVVLPFPETQVPSFHIYMLQGKSPS